MRNRNTRVGTGTGNNKESWAHKILTKYVESNDAIDINTSNAVYGNLLSKVAVSKERMKVRLCTLGLIILSIYLSLFPFLLILNLVFQIANPAFQATPLGLGAVVLLGGILIFIRKQIKNRLATLKKYIKAMVEKQTGGNLCTGDIAIALKTENKIVVNNMSDFIRRGYFSDGYYEPNTNSFVIGNNMCRVAIGGRRI